MTHRFPIRVDRVAGQWRATAQGASPQRAVLAVVRRELAPPEGFRIELEAPLTVGAGERRIEVDQTNESWILGEAVVVKWATGALAGPHPAPERLRRLAAAGFAETPTVRGMVEWRTPEGHWVPVVTVADFLPGTTDGWTWCLNEARIALGLRPGPPRPFAAALGALTGRMHRALADGPGGPIADHGDFHVGQILRDAADRLFVIDFDGNPTLTASERVAHRPAAYDVAGMLVSLENVGHVARHYDPQLSDADVVEWTEQVQTEFLTAYRSEAKELLDASLIEPMMLDQIRRELTYAETHLAGWRYVPEAALSRRGLLGKEME